MLSSLGANQFLLILRRRPHTCSYDEPSRSLIDQSENLVEILEPGAYHEL